MKGTKTLKDWVGDPLNPKPLPVVRIENAHRGSICLPVDDLIELMAWSAKGHAWNYMGPESEWHEADYFLAIWASLTGQLDLGERTELRAREAELQKALTK